jgi:hypothetical protein
VRGGQTARPSASIALFLADTFTGLATFAGGTKAQVHQTSEPEPTTPRDRLRRGIAEDQIFVELVARNERRNAALLKYTVLNTDQLIDLKGKVQAEEIGRMESCA